MTCLSVYDCAMDQLSTHNLHTRKNRVSRVASRCNGGHGVPVHTFPSTSCQSRLSEGSSMSQGPIGNFPPVDPPVGRAELVTGSLARANTELVGGGRTDGRVDRFLAVRLQTVLLWAHPPWLTFEVPPCYEISPLITRLLTVQLPPTTSQPNG